MTQERVEENYAAAYLRRRSRGLRHRQRPASTTAAQRLIDEGNDAAWFQLFTLAQNLANNPRANANNYWTMQGLNPDGTRNPSLPVLLDVDNLVDYMLIIFYTGGFDTGLSRFLGDNQANNWYGVYNRVAADQGFQFFIHDNEHSLGADGAVHGSQGIDRTGPFNNGNQSVYAQFNPQYLHQDLLAHPDYRQRIIDKVHEYLLQQRTDDARGEHRADAGARSPRSNRRSSPRRRGGATPQVNPPRNKVDLAHGGQLAG